MGIYRGIEHRAYLILPVDKLITRYLQEYLVMGFLGRVKGHSVTNVIGLYFIKKQSMQFVYLTRSELVQRRGVPCNSALYYTVFNKSEYLAMCCKFSKIHHASCSVSSSCLPPHYHSISA